MHFDQFLGAAHSQKLIETYKSTKKHRNQSKNAEKRYKKVKNQPKKDNFEVPPQGVNQLLHVDQL